MKPKGVDRKFKLSHMPCKDRTKRMKHQTLTLKYARRMRGKP